VATASPVLVIACGALAREITAIKRINGWEHLAVTCLAPELHNRPELITGAVLKAIDEARADGYEKVFVGYADCGTGGELDRALQPLGVQRLPGAHCYEFYATSAAFESMHDAEPGTFYLTDFLVRHFDRLVLQSLGLDRYPQLAEEYFRNYTRVVYLRQVTDAGLDERAAQAAQALGLPLQVVDTGYGELQGTLSDWSKRTGIDLVVEPAH
jgi:Protein of unknown function (DUF1638)